MERDEQKALRPLTVTSTEDVNTPRCKVAVDTVHYSCRTRSGGELDTYTRMEMVYSLVVHRRLCVHPGLENLAGSQSHFIHGREHQRRESVALHVYVARLKYLYK